METFYNVFKKKTQFCFALKKLIKTPSKVAQKNSNPLFSLLPAQPKQPKQKNSCFKMWSIVRLYIKLGPNFKSFFTGLPHGPFWIYSRFFEQMVFVHFENGELVPENVVLVDEKKYQFAVKVVTDRSSDLPFCPNRTEQVNQSSVSRNQTEPNM